MRGSIVVLIAMAFLAGSGCVMVNPGDVQMGSPSPMAAFKPKPSDPVTPYGPELERVLNHQHKVLKEIRKGDWVEVEDEASEWMERVRVLNGYAGTSHDPQRFRAYCDDLLAQIQAIRRAAAYGDIAGCHKALQNCDPILDAFSRDFPISALSPPPARSSATPGQAPAGPAPSPPPARIP